MLQQEVCQSAGAVCGLLVRPSDDLLVCGDMVDGTGFGFDCGSTREEDCGCESWWMLCLCSYDGGAGGAEGTVGEEEDGLKWAAREERRLRADDIVRPSSSNRYRYRTVKVVNLMQGEGCANNSGYAQLYKDLFGTKVSERDDAWDPKDQTPSSSSLISTTIHYQWGICGV
jgi:hypothetical protein